MAEFVAVLDEAKRPADVGGVAEIVNSRVIGLRVNDGPTIMRSDTNVEGRVHERSWDDMPDPLAFATQAFYRAIYVRGEVPPGRYFDCHRYVAYALGYTASMTTSDEVGGIHLESAPAPMPRLLLSPYRGYTMFDAESSRHSFVALPRRRGIVSESLSVCGKGSSLMVVETRLLVAAYNARRMYRVRGVAES